MVQMRSVDCAEKRAIVAGTGSAPSLSQAARAIAYVKHQHHFISICTQPVPMSKIKAIARANSIRVNAVVQAGVAGALREFFLKHRRPFTSSGVTNIPDYAVFPIAVPLRNHPPGLCNCMRTVTYSLPVGISDRFQRLQACNQMLNERSESLEPFISFVLMQLLSRMPTGVPILALMTRGLVEVALGMSNVAGPLNPIYFNGAPAIGMNSQFCAPGTPFFMGMLSYAGQLEYVCHGDPRVLSLEEVDEIGRLFATEFELMETECACARG